MCECDGVCEVHIEGSVMVYVYVCASGQRKCYKPTELSVTTRRENDVDGEDL
jgi:hypothetical protein